MTMMPRDDSMKPARDIIDIHPLHNARTLTKGGDQARIMLDDKVYTLRITRAGKLILTK